ncbi:apolipoprotein O, a isoform X2 [Neoarius graeffei]|uniref:apolipoprotein O, a isoform X2 n=1 Tax=Neoarius graeffei TaxID=443677 RepID=UPI00298C63EA|nr:apolipoprotein O, a isoform X2 [Neoarius graeffei]
MSKKLKHLPESTSVLWQFGGAAGTSAALSVMESSSSDTEKPKEISIEELSLYTTPQQRFHYVEPEKGAMEENVTTLRKIAEPYIMWCQGAYGVVKPRVDRTVQFGQDSYAYLRNPHPEFYPRAGVIGFAGILGLFLARGSRMKRLIYPTGLMAVAASMYYPQEAATIAKNTGDAVYDFTLQAYVTVEKLVTGKSTAEPKEKVMKAEEKPASGETKV